jgi:hypothetical protein
LGLVFLRKEIPLTNRDNLQKLIKKCSKLSALNYYVLGSSVCSDLSAVNDIDVFAINNIGKTSYYRLAFLGKELKIVNIYTEDLLNDINKRKFGGFFSSRYLNPFIQLSHDDELLITLREKAIKSHLSEYFRDNPNSKHMDSASCLNKFILYRSRYYFTYINTFIILKKFSENPSVKNFYKSMLLFINQCKKEEGTILNVKHLPSMEQQVLPYWKTRAVLKKEEVNLAEISQRVLNTLKKFDAIELSLLCNLITNS